MGGEDYDGVVQGDVREEGGELGCAAGEGDEEEGVVLRGVSWVSWEGRVGVWELTRSIMPRSPWRESP